jgi:hypothetical protein
MARFICAPVSIQKITTKTTHDTEKAAEGAGAQNLFMEVPVDEGALFLGPALFLLAGGGLAVSLGCVSLDTEKGEGCGDGGRDDLGVATVVGVDVEGARRARHQADVD